MKKNAQIQPWGEFDYTDLIKSFETDCRAYIQDNFEEYKHKETTFTPDRMDKIIAEGDDKLGRSCIKYIHTIKDVDSNGFFQYSLQKGDLPRMEWLIKKGNIQHHSEKEYTDFIRLSVEQLLPTKAEKEWKEGDVSLEESKKTRDTFYTLFKTVIDVYKEHEGFQPYGKFLVEEMMQVNLEHEKYSTSFTIGEDLLILFLPSAQDKTVLRDMYKKTVDKEHGDTFAHVFARLHKADKLYKLMENSYIAPILNKDEVKDKEGLTFFDIAAGKFIEMNPLDFKTDPEKARKIACCYQMSLKYVMLQKENWEDFNVTNNCKCGKHPILKEWSVKKECSTLPDPEESKYARCYSSLLKLWKWFFQKPTEQDLETEKNILFM